MSREEIKNRLKAGESVEFVMHETGKPFDNIYEIFEECKKEGYVKVHRSNRLRRKTPTGKLIYVPKTFERPEVYINIDRITSIVKDGNEITVYVDGIGYRISDEVLKAIASKMGGITMLIHQDETKDCIECWIELDKINFIKPQMYNGEICYYKLYLTGDNDPVNITQETFDKIVAEKGVV